MSKKDYYEALGAKKQDSAADLKKAYRKKAMKYHPDKNPDDKNAEQKFKEINHAYDILKDDQKRAAYDRLGHQAFENSGAGAAGGGAGGFNASGFSGAGFGDIFEDMFSDLMGGRGQAGGGGARRSAAQRGADISYDMEISLEESFKGINKNIKISTWHGCKTCNGSGAEEGSTAETCGTCRGVGRVRAQQGFFTVERTCPSCSGAGQIIKNPCKKCGGSGRSRNERSLQVSIPKGIEDGTRIRLAGEGEAGVRGGPAGDLYVFLNIKQHPFFKRDNANIHCRVPVPMHLVTLGGTVEVPTIDGRRMKVSIPTGTQTGQQFRLKNKGMTILRATSRGDMFVEVITETPVNLTKKQKELLEQFAGQGNSKTNPKSTGFFNKIKDIWEELKD